ncbi:hypothetical protein J582_3553 [Acinetobacter sp. 1566109]|nr:hypothetical protein J582_3553 [Acinetobacter sp. 1566109]
MSDIYPPYPSLLSALTSSNMASTLFNSDLERLKASQLVEKHNLDLLTV